ncbi:Hypothetical protein PACV_307 [Pacmanvirus A23]|uniref:Hypothetical protein n=1 Tax=Pacmanvirus A23 TaxID=1932881 RepID=UPI000A0932E3|nr:Hypothetical protein B9W72_gp303 [Pacmanvirus A23]SIP86020.1 Hypothetical protein PACV_307 [Pacmanvirus A23]
MDSITLICKHGLKLTICEEDLKNIPVLYQRYLNKINQDKISLVVNFDHSVIIKVIDYYVKSDNNFTNDIQSILQFAIIYNCFDLRDEIIKNINLS